jgi:hypothetical protein
MEADSLDSVEAFMAMEEELNFEVPDQDAERSDTLTFDEMVVLMRGDHCTIASLGEGGVRSLNLGR